MNSFLRWFCHRGHLKDKRRQLKHHTTFCVNMFTFGAQPNYGVSVFIYFIVDVDD
jgi:hypothetical protein